MAGVLIRKQSLEEKLARTSERLRRAQNTARKLIKGMPAAKRIFYEAYYVEHAKHATACRIARISESTAYRYMRQIGDTSQ